MVHPLSKDWLEFLSLLNSHRVKYLLVGAHAVAIHGQARMTADLDVFVEASRPNARRILAVLRDFGFESVAPSLEELAEERRVFMLGRSPHRIDILTKISGVRFATAFAGRSRIETKAGMINVIGKKELIANKRAAGRVKDRLDLELLRVPTSRPRRRHRSHRARVDLE